MGRERGFAIAELEGCGLTGEIADREPAPPRAGLGARVAQDRVRGDVTGKAVRR
jgi:hypothetical protein